MKTAVMVSSSCLKLKSPAVDAVLLDDAFQHRHVKGGNEYSADRLPPVAL